MIFIHYKRVFFQHCTVGFTKLCFFFVLPENSTKSRTPIFTVTICCCRYQIASGGCFKKRSFLSSIFSTLFFSVEKKTIKKLQKKKTRFRQKFYYIFVIPKLVILEIRNFHQNTQNFIMLTRRTFQKKNSLLFSTIYSDCKF